MTNKEVVLGFLKAADKNDETTVAKLFGKQHQFYSTMSPQPMNAEQHLGLLNTFNSGFSDSNHEVLDMIESGNKVILRGVWHGKHTGEFNSIPASGKQVHLSFIMIIEVENGEMKNHWIEMDGMSFMMQIGAIPMPANA